MRPVLSPRLYLTYYEPGLHCIILSLLGLFMPGIIDPCNFRITKNYYEQLRNFNSFL